MMKRTSRPASGDAALASPMAAAAPAATHGKMPALARTAMPRAVRARAAASAAARQRAGRSTASAAAAAAANPDAPRIGWAGGAMATARRPASAGGSTGNNAADHGLTLHDTLYADANGAVHYRGADDPRGDRRAVMSVLREMERCGSLEGGCLGNLNMHGAAGSPSLSGGGSDCGGAMAAGGGGGRAAARARAPKRAAAASAHAARQRLEPIKFVRGAKACKHTHMVDQPRARSGAKA